MRILKALQTLFILLALQGASSLAIADVPKPPVGGAYINVTLQKDGTIYDDSGTKVQLCPDGYKFEVTTNPGSFEERGDPNLRVTQVVDGVEQVYFHTICVRIERDDDAPGLNVINQRSFWVGVPALGAVIPEALDQVTKLVNPPIVSWPTMDREFGWLYANTAMEFRVAALTPVTATVSLENILGSVTATAVATPVSVTFISGEPNGAPVTCSVADAVAGFAPTVVGACSYRYRNSSALAPNGREFAARMVVNWEVTGDIDPTAPTTLETYTDTNIAVAEVQAIVCSDGGC